MESRIGAARVHYVERGNGIPLIALHGAGVDHREIEAACEELLPAKRYRRIYPDLPGMGRSTADGLNSNADVVSLLARFVDQLGARPVLLLGHSYGAYLARGLAAQRPQSVLGLALLCPVADGSGPLPGHEVVRQDADAHAELKDSQREAFDDYFVVRTAATARRYRDHVAPAAELVDEAALGRIFARWPVEVGSTSFTAPTLVVAGRRDSAAGYVDAVGLLDQYPQASLTVVEDAGHALMHERPRLVGALLADWLERAEHPR